MKYGVVGNREGWDNDFVTWKISDIIFNDEVEEISEVEIISGGAIGIDYYAKIYALENKIPFKEFLPNSEESIPQRYFNRNKKIAEECDVLIAFDKKIGASGTKNTIKYAKELSKKVILITTDSSENL